MKKHKVNHSYFREIDTEDKAYWLGFLAADGWISTRRNEIEGIGIRLQFGDINHLLKFKKYINSTHKIHIGNNSGYGKGYKFCQLTIPSKKIAYDLIDKGVIPNKSLRLKPPNKVSPNLERHYWRGYFDGNGCFCRHRDKRIIRGFNYELNIVGSKYICNGFLNFIRKNGINTSTIPSSRKKNKSFSVKFIGFNLPISIIMLLYYNSTIYLDRKKIFIEQEIEYSTNYRIELIEEDIKVGGSS